MAAFNVVRFRVKPGQEQRFLDSFTADDRPAGAVRACLIKTGERTYCAIGEWTDLEALAAARSKMIGHLDTIRDALEDLGGGVGVTDAVSGSVVRELR
ncbi:MAG: antibiotic biosynthesis monooxygenase [Deltaproteobacteria bacterium]|nr:antibiotic biosynthesis monooxygenase [Deltaproteobacteria bacterium]